MKKIIIYIGLFIFLCMMSNYGIDYTVGKQIEKQSPYYLSFASIGANSLESRLDCWAKIKTTSSKTELNSYLLNILRSLNLPAEQNKFGFESNDNSTILSYETTYETIKYHFIMESNETTKETYFIVNLITNEESNLPGIPAKLNNIIGLHWTYYYQYTGSLNMPVNAQGSQELLNVMMKNLKVEDPDLYIDGNTCSGTGYSQELAKIVPSIKVNNRDINIQIAVQNDESKHQTNIIIGSPLILGEY